MLDDQLKKFDRLNFLIKRKNTGSRKALSDKLEVSVRTVQDYINLMKLNGAPIRFCRHYNSYIYEEDGEFKIEFGFFK